MLSCKRGKHLSYSRSKHNCTSLRRHMSPTGLSMQDHESINVLARQGRRLLIRSVALGKWFHPHHLKDIQTVMCTSRDKLSFWETKMKQKNLPVPLFLTAWALRESGGVLCRFVTAIPMPRSCANNLSYRNVHTNTKITVHTNINWTTVNTNRKLKANFSLIRQLKYIIYPTMEECIAVRKNMVVSDYRCGKLREMVKREDSILWTSIE